MKPLALIPARGNSKRLPRKNIQKFLGRPLIAFPIAAARESGLFSQIAVSTQDPEIAEIARAEGATIIERPAELASDTSPVTDACLHALDVTDAKDLCCIYATAALITPSDLVDSFDIYRKGVHDSVMGVGEYNLPPVQALQEVDGNWQLRWPEFHRVQSQHHPDLVCSCGMLYWISADALRSKRTFYTDKLGIYRVPSSRICDINTLEDFENAERRAQLLTRSSD